MAYLPPAPKPVLKPGCKCIYGYYSQPDPFGRTNYRQLTSYCPRHWPHTHFGLKLVILKNEGVLWIDE